MNLVCFPHYTAGGLLCDILNSVSSEVGDNGGLKNMYHTVGKIGDSDQIFDVYDPTKLYEKIDGAMLPNGQWVATHCWPGILDLSRFDKIINLTTVTYRSRLFRWARAYTLYFNKKGLSELAGIDKIDKMRSLAKNYIKPFTPVMSDNVINLEFSSIVDFDYAAYKIIKDSERYEFWKSHNAFLYDVNFWQSEIVKRFHEAEYESVTGFEYEYQ